MKEKRILAHFAVYIFLFICLVPFVWLVWTSLKTGSAAFRLPPVWIFSPNFDSYAGALSAGGMAQAILTSAYIALFSSLVGLLCGVPLAYAITQLLPLWSRSANRVALFILLLTVIPPAMSLVPLYRQFFQLGLTKGIWALAIVHTFYATLLSILVMRSFLVDFPPEIREAALIDGARELRILGQCVLPNLIGPIFAIFVLALIQSWNEYFYALVLLSAGSKTAPVTVASFLSFYGTNWSQLTAAGVLAAGPIIIFAVFVRKYLAQGLTFGGVK